MRKGHGILDDCDVKKGEVILALLFRPQGKSEAHLVKFIDLKRGREGLISLLESSFWEDVRQTFLSVLRRR